MLLPALQPISIFVIELFEAMEKHSRLKQSARFYVITSCLSIIR